MHSNFTDIHKQFTFYLDTLGYSTSSINKYSRKSDDFFKWLTSQDITHITGLKHAHVINFFEYQKTRKNIKFKGVLSDIYLNDYFIGIDKLLEFLHQIGAKNTPSPTNYRISINDDKRIRNIQPFTIEEIKLLQSKIHKLYPNYKYKKREVKQYQLQLVFALYYGCGLRLNEGYNLTVKDIDFNKKTIFIRQGKNYKDRIVPITDTIYKVLQDYIYNFRHHIKCNHNRLFVHTTRALLKSLKHLQQNCDNEPLKSKLLHFHILRHSIATHLLQKGMPIENIARFLGHNSLTSTQIYTHIINR